MENNDSRTVAVGCLVGLAIIVLFVLATIFWGWVLQYIIAVLFGRHIGLLASSLIILFFNYVVAKVKGVGQNDD